MTLDCNGESSQAGIFIESEDNLETSGTNEVIEPEVTPPTSLNEPLSN